MRLSAKNLSEGTAKGFTDVQKGKLMGFCQVLAWRDMPQIWKDIEKTKTDEDLRVVLGEYWARYKRDLNVNFYDIYWDEEILTALRKVALTKSGRATYQTSETCISPLLLMPHLDEVRLEIEKEYQRRKAAGRNVTVADLKKAERTPRLPPLRWEDLVLLMTTYALFLEILFTSNNEHLKGLN